MKYQRRKGARRYPKRKNKGQKMKRMVTGHGPSTIERIAQGAGALGTLARAIVPIATAINTEFKFKDVVTNNTVVYDTSATTLFKGFADTIIEGNDQQQRSGSSILGQSYLLRLRMQLKYDNTSADRPYGFLARVIVLCYKGDTETDPISTTKLFQDNTNILSPLNKEFSDQIVVLEDSYIPINANELASKADNTGNEFGMTYYHQSSGKCNWHLKYDATDHATINHLYYYVGCDIGLNAGPTPSSNNCLIVNAYSRFNFTDN